MSSTAAIRSSAPLAGGGISPVAEIASPRRLRRVIGKCSGETAPVTYAAGRRNLKKLAQTGEERSAIAVGDRLDEALPSSVRPDRR
jgi:hypothetical protein